MLNPCLLELDKTASQCHSAAPGEEIEKIKAVSLKGTKRLVNPLHHSAHGFYASAIAWITIFVGIHNNVITDRECMETLLIARSYLMHVPLLMPVRSFPLALCGWPRQIYFVRFGAWSDWRDRFFCRGCRVLPWSQLRTLLTLHAG